ncbi:hypothetical protein A8L45_01370 [Veronia pacifica]|uniref:DUF2491 domain-containing protein n=1 Tax=Veronia pacifica TaxID=1080227 RepID=A0A1C3ESU8_9GAMM|nr:hypothetical protein A8L45_01370 [Veronia pacifica]
MSDSKHKQASGESAIPQVLGFTLGAVVNVDRVRLAILEDDLTFENASASQTILAVGVVPLGEGTRVIRYYTDDDGFFQILQQGTQDSGVKEISLWYFFDNTPIDTDSRWDTVLADEVVTPERHYELDGNQFDAYWGHERPVAMTETTYTSDGQKTETDQFVMLYSRDISDGLTEELMIAAEEKGSEMGFERIVARSTGIQLKRNHFKVMA